MYKLPYNKSNPVVYDNDSHEDEYTDEYLMSLASSEDINLKGIITTISYVDAWQKPEIQYNSLVNGREEIAGKARRSGMKNIPNPVRGPSVALLRPLSGRIEDTVPINSLGSRLIVQEAKSASPEKPLVIIMGGQSTSVADAYLLDNSISENIIVAWLAGEGASDLYGYNGWVDPWGTYIIVARLKTVLFGPVCPTAPIVPKRRLTELPETELRQWMIEKELPHVNLPAEKAGDAQPAIPLMRPDYVKRVIRKSFNHFDKDGMPLLKDDEKGNILMVTKADKNIATEEWWRALKDHEAYGGNPVKPTNTPYNGVPFLIPGIIDAEQFDYGGEGVGYHCRSSKNGSQVLKAVYRMTDHVKFDYCSDSRGSFIVEQLECNEWLKYTVDVKRAGKYSIEIRATSGMAGGILHLELDGINRSGSICIPGTGGWQEWRTIAAGKVNLDSGIQVVKLVCDSGRFNIDYFMFKDICTRED